MVGYGGGLRESGPVFMRWMDGHGHHKYLKDGHGTFYIHFRVKLYYSHSKIINIMTLRS